MGWLKRSQPYMYKFRNHRTDRNGLFYGFHDFISYSSKTIRLKVRKKKTIHYQFTCSNDTIYYDVSFKKYIFQHNLVFRNWSMRRRSSSRWSFFHEWICPREVPQCDNHYHGSRWCLCHDLLSSILPICPGLGSNSFRSFHYKCNYLNFSDTNSWKSKVYVCK